MRISDYIYLANKNLTMRKKSAIISVILVSLSMVILVVGLSVTKNFLDVVDKAINKNISYRTVAVIKDDSISQDELINKISKINNIQKIVPQNQYEIGIQAKNINNNNLDWELDLLGSDIDIQPEVILGNKIENDNDSVCIVPKKFYPYYLNEDFDESKIIDGETLIGKEITIEYYSYDFRNGKKIKNNTFNKNLKIIGVYDQDEIVNNYNCCYVPFNIINDIDNQITENEIYDKNTVVLRNESVFAIVNDASNVKSVINEVNELGYKAIVRSEANLELVNIINTVCIIVSFFLIIISIISIIIPSIKSIVEKKYEIGMQKAVGFKNITIEIILFTENLIIGVISYIVTTILSIISIKIINVILLNKNYQTKQLNLNLRPEFFAIAFIISILIPLISSLLCNSKILKETPLSLNKES